MKIADLNHKYVTNNHIKDQLSGTRQMLQRLEKVLGKLHALIEYMLSLEKEN